MHVELLISYWKHKVYEKTIETVNIIDKLNISTIIVSYI